MNSKFISSLFIIVILNLLVKPFYVFGIDLSIQNRLGSAEYGNYFSLYSLSLLFNIVLDMGINNYNTKNIAQNPEVLQKYLGKIFGIRIVLFFLYAILIFLIGVILDYDDFQFEMLIYLVITQFFAAGILFLRSNFGGLHLFKIDGFISILDRLILIGLASVLLWGGIYDYYFDIIYFVYAQTLATAVAFFIALFILLSKAKLNIKLEKRITFTILKRSFPYALLIVLMMVYSRVDSIMLERISGPEEAGFYAQPFRILDAFNMTGYIFVGLLLPMITRLLKDKGDFMSLVDLAFRILIPFSIIAFGLTFFFSKEIMNAAYNEISVHVPQTFLLLMVSFIGICLTFVYGTLLTADGAMKILNIAALSGLILNIVLNSILIPNEGAEGAAIATVITQLSVSCIQIVVVHRKFNANKLYRTYAIVGVYAILILFAFYHTARLDLSWVVIIFLNIAISTLLYFGFGIIKFKELKTIFLKDDE